MQSTSPTERPILFSGPMVRAILGGRKTMTRRVVKDINQTLLDASPEPHHIANAMRCSYGVPGDRLWVRESFQPLMADGVAESEWLSCNYKTGKGYKISYPATDSIVEFYDMGTDNAFCNRVTPSIHMPRWASRITLEVTAVRVERVQSISEADAVSEGVERLPDGHWKNYCGDWRGKIIDATDAVTSFRTLWDSINGKRCPWASNPWCWVVEFKKA